MIADDGDDRFMKQQDELTDLIRLTARGDEGAYKTLYEKTSPRLFSVSLKLLKRRDWAEDVTQEAYVRVWYHAKEYHTERGQPLTWMISILRNLAIDKLRSRSAQEVEGDESPDELAFGGLGPVKQMMQSQSAMALEGCIDELSEAQRTSIFLSFFEGLSHQQVTARMDEPLGTVKSWVRRGLQSLRRCLER